MGTAGVLAAVCLEPVSGEAGASATFIGEAGLQSPSASMMTGAAAKEAAPVAMASFGLRRHHRRNRSAGPTGRAQIGSPRR
jgi:hypothetical protein